MEFVRVKDRTTGHEYSTRHPHPEKVDVLEDEPAVDRKGKPLAAKAAAASPKTPDAKPASEKPVAIPASAKNGGEPAENPEEGSK